MSQQQNCERACRYRYLMPPIGSNKVEDCLGLEMCLRSCGPVSPTGAGGFGASPGGRGINGSCQIGGGNPHVFSSSGGGGGGCKQSNKKNICIVILLVVIALLILYMIKK